VAFIDAKEREVPFLEKARYRKRSLVSEIARRYSEMEPADRELRKRQRESGTAKRDLSLRAKGIIDPWVSLDNISC
jgi:hypothetical protein